MKFSVFTAKIKSLFVATTNVCNVLLVQLSQIVPDRTEVGVTMVFDVVDMV